MIRRKRKDDPRGLKPALERDRPRLKSLRKNLEISGWSLEGARLAAPYIVFKDLRHGREAVPFQNSNARSFFRKL
jgi:hypothetical protein